VPESWDIGSGTSTPAAQLAEWILTQPAIDGITLSGGEPMLQAAALIDLIDRVRLHADLGVMCYTGYTYDHLLKFGDAAQRDLLARLDILIDGPYIESRHADRLWRGSDNQRILCLTPRYVAIVAQRLEMDDRAAGMEMFANAAGAIGYVGVPSHPGFHDSFNRKLKEFGVVVCTKSREEVRL